MNDVNNSNYPVFLLYSEDSDGEITIADTCQHNSGDSSCKNYSAYMNMDSKEFKRFLGCVVALVNTLVYADIAATLCKGVSESLDNLAKKHPCGKKLVDEKKKTMN